MVIRKPAAKKTPTRSAAPAKKSTPAKKTAAPAKSTPAKRTATKPAPKATPKPAAKAAPIQAHDVARAERAVFEAEKVVAAARARHAELRAAYWAQYGEVLDGAVDHAAKAAELTPSPKLGPKSTNEGPARKALAKEPVIEEYFDRDETEALSLRELRELAAELAEKGIITETMKKAVILQQMEDKGLFREDGSSEADEDDVDDDEDGEDIDEDESDDSDEEDDDESDDDDEDDDDGDGEEGYSLSELKAMSLKELQDVAENNRVPWEGLKQSALIKALMEAEPQDDEEDDEEEEEEEELELSVEDIEAMDIPELLNLLERMGYTEKIPLKTKKNHDALVKLVLENLEGEDEDEEEDDEE